MQSDKKIQNRHTNVPDFNFEAAEKVNCNQIKIKLDELFSGRFMLEKMDRPTKIFLFRHLENCSDCCRSFDVRVHFRPTGRGAIY
jgi:hypothetical protein